MTGKRKVRDLVATAPPALSPADLDPGIEAIRAEARRRWRTWIAALEHVCTDPRSSGTARYRAAEAALLAAGVLPAIPRTAFLATTPPEREGDE